MFLYGHVHISRCSDFMSIKVLLQFNHYINTRLFNRCVWAVKIYHLSDEHFNLCFVFKRSATIPIFFKCYDYHFSVIDEESFVHIFFITGAQFVFLHCYQINGKATLIWQRMQCESKCSGSKWGGDCGAHYLTPFDGHHKVLPLRSLSA